MLLLRVLGSEGTQWTLGDDTILMQKMSDSRGRRSGWTSTALLAIISLAVQGESSVSIFSDFPPCSTTAVRGHHSKRKGLLSSWFEVQPITAGHHAGRMRLIVTLCPYLGSRER